ncbi:condensation domain-containing protein, partial [Methylolobus aquaticus]
PVPHRDLDDLYPLSPLQQGLLFHAVHAPDNSVYMTQLAVGLEALDVARFEQAWREVTDRHAVLRTGFLWRGELSVPLQFVLRQVKLPVRHLDWRVRIVDDSELAAEADADLALGFDLERPPLSRLTLIQLPGGVVRMIWTSHHLLLDGWSTSALLGEVMETYAGSPPRPAPGRYRDYIAWLQARDTAGDEAFWRRQLQPLEEPTRLTPATGVRGPRTGHGQCVLRVSPERTRQLQTYAQRVRVTLNTLIQGAWVMLLSRSTGRRTVSFGATVAGRPGDLPGVESLIGLFINTLPVIYTVDPRRAVGDWLSALQALNVELREHEHTPLYDIQHWAGRRELFDTLLVFENYPVDRALGAAAGGVRIDAAQQTDVTSYPLTVDVTGGETLEIGFEYACDRFDEAAVQQLSTHFEALLFGFVEDASRPLGVIGLPFAAGSRSLSEIPIGAGIAPVPGLIARWAAGQPDAVAVVAGEECLSYGA